MGLLPGGGVGYHTRPREHRLLYETPRARARTVGAAMAAVDPISAIWGANLVALLESLCAGGDRAASRDVCAVHRHLSNDAYAPFKVERAPAHAVVGDAAAPLATVARHSQLAGVFKVYGSDPGAFVLSALGPVDAMLALAPDVAPPAAILACVVRALDRVMDDGTLAPEAADDVVRRAVFGGHDPPEPKVAPPSAPAYIEPHVTYSVERYVIARACDSDFFARVLAAPARAERLAVAVRHGRSFAEAVFDKLPVLVAHPAAARAAADPATMDALRDVVCAAVWRMLTCGVVADVPWLVDHLALVCAAAPQSISGHVEGALAAAMADDDAVLAGSVVQLACDHHHDHPDKPRGYADVHRAVAHALCVGGLAALFAESAARLVDTRVVVRMCDVEFMGRLCAKVLKTGPIGSGGDADAVRSTLESAIAALHALYHGRDEPRARRVVAAAAGARLGAHAATVVFASPVVQEHTSRALDADALGLGGANGTGEAGVLGRKGRDACVAYLTGAGDRVPAARAWLGVWKKTEHPERHVVVAQPLLDPVSGAVRTAWFMWSAVALGAQREMSRASASATAAAVKKKAASQ